MVGKSTFGSGATGRLLIGDQSDKQDADHDQRGRNRELDEGRGNTASHDQSNLSALGFPAVRYAWSSRTWTGPPGCTR